MQHREATSRTRGTIIEGDSLPAQLNTTAMFNHADGRLPVSVDRWLRWVVVIA